MSIGLLPQKRLRLGHLLVDHVTFEGAIDAIEALVDSGRGGSVFTPNVDHFITAETDAAFRLAYGAASLSLADGMPVLWASKLLGEPLPAKISGSDLLLPLVERAAKRGFRVYLLGGAPGVAEASAILLSQRFAGLNIVGTDGSRVDPVGDATADSPIIQRLRAAKPDLVLVALGAPKQELWIHNALEHLRPAVALGIGASLDFIAGTVRRAPPWMSRSGLEWLFRLGQEPKRMWRRYLVRGPQFRHVVARSLKAPRAQRTVTRQVRPAVPAAVAAVAPAAPATVRSSPSLTCSS